MELSPAYRYYPHMKLSRHLVEKPWGRTDIPPVFGQFAGRQIGEIWFEAPEDRELPVLVKWLFTSEKLSIQVHPNDAEARALGQASGKEECWYVVSAEPGAVLGIGTKEPMDGEALRAASLDGSIEGMMDWKPVKPGDFYYIPAGTVHAIGAGVTLVEVQQYADITYRLYDYGRPRELHLKDGVAVSKPAPYTDKRSGEAEPGEQLVDGPFFRLWLVEGTEQLAALPSDVERWIVPLSGAVHVGDEIGAIGDCLLVGPNVAVEGAEDAKLLVAAL